MNNFDSSVTDTDSRGAMRNTVRNVLSGSMAGLALVASLANAVPVIPGAAGFGIETPAGRGGTVYRVSNLNDTGTGSLRACVEASGPRVCVFEVSGTIRLAGELEVRNPYLTIAGQTAPSPGILLRGAGLSILVSDVLVQHLRVRVGDDPSGPPAENRDALRVETWMNPVKNVVIDHCSFSWSIDEMASLYAKVGDVSLLNNIFAEPLNDSMHPKGPHGYGPILGSQADGVGNISMVGNVLAHHVARNPLSRASGLVFVNNVVYDQGDSAVALAGDGYPTANALAGNIFINGPNSGSAWKSIILVADPAEALVSGTRVYLADNSAAGANSDPWSIVSVQSPLQRGDISASSAPLWPAGLSAKSTAGGAALNDVLAKAGARPVERDSADTRIIGHIRSGGGQIINCVAADGSARCAKNAGGWPTLQQNTRAFAMPANANQVTSSGYTNLELRLHEMARAVEGAGPVPKAPVNMAAN